MPLWCSVAKIPGLTNEELALADVLTGVPMVADYPSLNLGQAVMVLCAIN